MRTIEKDNLTKVDLPLQFLLQRGKLEKLVGDPKLQNEDRFTYVRFYKSKKYQTAHAIHVGLWKPISNIYNVQQ